MDVVRSVLAGLVSACTAYDASLLPSGSTSATPADPPLMTEVGAGGMPATTVAAGHQAPALSVRPTVDAALPAVDDASVPDAPIEQWDRKRLTIDARFVDEDLHDFPLFVTLAGDADLMRARADGRSLYFTDPRGQVLDADVEARDLAAGELSAWVRVPLVSSRQDTVLYLYWEDGADHSTEQSAMGVWSADFEAVFHLNDARDSSAHAHHGEDLGSTAASGRLAGARSFDGKSYIAIGEGMLPASASYTISAWIRPDLASCADYCAVVTNSRPASPFEGIALYVAGTFAPETTGALGTWEDSVPVTDSWHFSDANVVTSGSWRFVALTMQIGHSDGVAEISLDGQPWTELYRPSDGDTMGFQNAADSQLDIGRFESADGFFHEYAGDIDELRIASTTRSAAWIHAEYENQRSESTFLSVVTERR